MDRLWQDIRYSLRTLRRSPGFAIIIVLILTIAITANTAVFSVVDAVVLQPLPYGNANRIVIPWIRGADDPGFATSIQNFKFLREQNRVFEHLAASQGRRFYVTGIARPHEARALAVSPCLFSLLGIQPVLGRGFLPEEEQPGRDRVVILSHEFWRDYQGSDTEAVGKTIGLNGEVYTIAGVMSAGFEFPFARSTSFWVPLMLKQYSVGMTACLKKGVTLEQAQAEMTVLARQLAQMAPAANAEIIGGVDKLLDKILQGNGTTLLLLLGAVALVLLVACSNVASLYLARAAIRQHEMAIRVALGASRAHTIRQMLTESVVLSLAAGLLGVVLTFWVVQGLVCLCPVDIPRLKDASINPTVFLFTLGISVLTGLFFGVMPAWRASDVRVGEILREGAVRGSTGQRWRHLHAGFIVAQIGISLVLLAGTTLLIRSLIALQDVELGFQPKNMLAMHINLPGAKYPETYQCRAFFDELLKQIRALPAVHSAALVCPGLEWGGEGAYIALSLDNRPAIPGEQRIAKQMIVSTGFLETMGIELLKGRAFADPDMRQDMTSCVIIDENTARKYFADVDPVGQKINGLPVVGVVRAVRDFELLTPLHDTIYMPLSGGTYFQGMDVLVRTQGDPMRLASPIRSRVMALDKDQAVTQMEPLEVTLARMLAPRRFSMVLLGAFSSVSVVLAAVGVYGLLHYSTAQQTRDVGVRMALGARRVDILSMVLRQGLRLALIGVAAGLAGALALTRLLTSLLYGVAPTDPLTLACVSLVLVAIAMLASLIPACWAARLDVMVALRNE